MFSLIPNSFPRRSPVDSLGTYYHWGDQQCLVQAILVAQEQPIDIQEVRRWSVAEGKLTEFAQISPRLASPPKQKA